MIDLRTEEDGTITAEWNGREVRDSRRGFYMKGYAQSPTCRKKATKRKYKVVPTHPNIIEASERGGKTTRKKWRREPA